MINELDEIALVKALPEFKLEAGDVGTVVMVHPGGQGIPPGYTVEFMTYTGKTVAIATLPANAVRSISAHDIAHVREVA